MQQTRPSTADQPKKGTRILFRSQLVLLLAFVLFAMVFSVTLTCGQKEQVRQRTNNQKEIRR